MLLVAFHFEAETNPVRLPAGRRRNGIEGVSDGVPRVLHWQGMCTPPIGQPGYSIVGELRRPLVIRLSLPLARSLVQGVHPRWITLPVSVFKVGIVVDVPAGPPVGVTRIAQVVSFRRFDVTVTKQNVSAVIMAVCRAGRMAGDRFDIRGFAVTVEPGSHVSGHGWNVANPNHVRRPLNRRVFDWALSQTPVNVSAQTQLRSGDRLGAVLEVNAPVVVTQAEEGSIDNGSGIIDAAWSGST